MAGTEENTMTSNQRKLNRCVDWLQKQNELVPKKLSLQNQNDIQFIIECNAQRRKFFLSGNNDDITVPAGVDEPPVVPLRVPIKKLRVENLRMLCEWGDCQCYFVDYELFQKHVAAHIPEFAGTVEGKPKHECLWDICGYKTTDYNELVRHIHYHAYHAKLLAIGFNGRATLQLERCKKDSSKRNKIPIMNADHCCMWTGCDVKYKSVQAFFDHVKRHISYSDEHVCSWGGCGAHFPRRVHLTTHVRRHTVERLIACYHCGRHFSNNKRLRDHLARQNVPPDAPHQCDMCGKRCATRSMLNEHARQHVSAHACPLCDMSAPSAAALAHHARYRHVRARGHGCALCAYRAVSKWDLKKHMEAHERKKKQDEESDVGPSDEEDSDGEPKRKRKEGRRYECHLCPNERQFSRGNRLTEHLVNVHGAQWSYGYSRFRYQICEDGIYRLITTRYEYEEISRKIVDGYSGPKGSLSNSKLKFELKQVAEPTDVTPRKFKVILKNENEIKDEMNKELKMKDGKDNEIEITMCDVDEEGNIISSQIINSINFTKENIDSQLDEDSD